MSLKRLLAAGRVVLFIVFIWTERGVSATAEEELCQRSGIPHEIHSRPKIEFGPLVRVEVACADSASSLKFVLYVDIRSQVHVPDEIYITQTHAEWDTMT